MKIKQLARLKRDEIIWHGIRTGCVLLVLTFLALAMEMVSK